MEGLVPLRMEEQRNSWGNQQSLQHLLVTGRDEQLRKGFPSFPGAGCGIKSWLGFLTAFSVSHERVNSHFSPSKKEHRGKKILVISVD